MHKKSTKQHNIVSCVYRIPVLRSVKFKRCNPNLSLPAPAKFLYSIFMSRFASQSLNKYWHCNAMIFV